MRCSPGRIHNSAALAEARSRIASPRPMPSAQQLAAEVQRLERVREAGRDRLRELEAEGDSLRQETRQVGWASRRMGRGKAACGSALCALPCRASQCGREQPLLPPHQPDPMSQPHLPPIPILCASASPPQTTPDPQVQFEARSRSRSRSMPPLPPPRRSSAAPWRPSPAVSR